MDEKMVEIAFQLISHGGNARGMAMEAINAAKQNNIEEARDLIKQAREEILNAHEFQTTRTRPPYDRYDSAGYGRRIC